MKQHDQEQLGKQKIPWSSQLCGYTSSLRRVREGLQERNLEAGADAEAMNILIGSSRLAYPAFFSMLRSLLIDNIAHKELGMPKLIANQGNSS